MALFSRQKKEKRKGQESTIGKIIYSFLLFMPLLSIAVTCMYAVFNKNAKDSYSDESIYKQFVMQLNDTLNTNTVYELHYKNFTSHSVSFEITYISKTKEDLGMSQAQYDTINTLQLTDNKMNIKYQNGSTQAWKILTLNENFESFNIILSRSVTITQNIADKVSITNTVLVQNKLDNVFTYSIKKVEQSELYNWSKNTGTYNVLYTTTTGLGITTTFVPMLMAYWLIISVIYFIYDIGLMLVWIIHRKIHELQEEI